MATIVDSPYSNLDNIYSNFFLDYASYVILERAIPHINDGLKPVQRRILHSMNELEDGRYNKVANIIGNTAKYHPHGDASVGEAIVGIGQKNYLIDTQGNWGNIPTGDSAAAPRYIEARLSPLAKDIIFSPKITKWQKSYDGRNKEPITFPVKFPLILLQGIEGIAVGLACKIFPHNFNELIDSCISYLQKKEFTLLPDFPCGGIVDATNYNHGLKGGRLRIRAKIETDSKRTLYITELPHSTTTSSLIDSIIQASESGKIKISKIEDLTAEEVKIKITLPSGTNIFKLIQSLYVFTNCEISLSPNLSVIDNEKPKNISVENIIAISANRTRELLKEELEIKRNELLEKWISISLEKIFIENKIYRKIENCTSFEHVIETVKKGLKPYIKDFFRQVVREDYLKLLEIRIKRISKYNSFECDKSIKNLEAEIDKTEKNIKNITKFTIKFYRDLKKKHGKNRERKSKLTTFEKVNAQKFALSNETLYINRKEGFLGWGMKKEEELFPCSRLNDILVILKDGSMVVFKNATKKYVGKYPIFISLFSKDSKKTYCLIYYNKKLETTYVKHFKIGGITREKTYNLTDGNKILFLKEIKEGDKPPKIVARLKPKLRLRNLEITYDFSELTVKSRGSKGNILSKNPIEKIKIIAK